MQGSCHDSGRVPRSPCCPRSLTGPRFEPSAAEFIGNWRRSTTQETPTVRRLENQSFLLLLVAVTLAFAWILVPFYGAILWAIVVAVIFAPLNRRLQQQDGRAAESRRRGHGADRDCDGHSAAGLDHGVAAAGSLRPLRQGAVRGVQLRRLHSAGVRRPAGLGDRPAGSLQPDGSGQGSRQPGSRAGEGRTGGCAAGAQHRHEHVRLRGRRRHHAVPAVFPVARRQGAGGTDQAGRSAPRRPEDRVVRPGSPMSSAPR